MPSRENPSYSSSRVQRASRLNALEQIRLQQKLILLENARLHQVKLTNQDIRLTSTALEYILNCSGHSLEGRGPTGQPGGATGGGETGQQEEPCFLYGERVVSRKVRRMPRPQSAVERSTFRRGSAAGPQDREQNGAAADGENGGKRLPPRPQSSPAKGRSSTWAAAWTSDGDADGEWNGDGGWKSPGGGGDGAVSDSERPPSLGGGSSPPGSASRPSSGRATPVTGRGGRTTPRQAWEDDTDEVTKRILKAQKLQQQQQEQLQQELSSRRRSNRYMQDIGRMRSQGFRQPRGGRGGGTTSPFPGSTNSTAPSPGLCPPAASPSPRVASPWERPLTSTPRPQTSTPRPQTSTPRPPQQQQAVIEDRKPVSPSEKRSQSGRLGKRAGVTEIMSQARATMSASAWRTHLASTQMMPRSAESQQQVIMEARKNCERERQERVMHKVETFMGELDNKRNG